MNTLRFCCCLLILGMGIAPVWAKTPAARDKKPTSHDFPSFDDVKQTVEDHFAATRTYEAGDLITAGGVGPLFGKLEKMNWKVADRKEILKSVLPESDWLSRQFSTRNGRKFMREIGELPDGYDRVDRMRRMPYGERRVADMIRSPGGSKMIEYMTTTREGKNLGKQVSRGVNGQNFNKPTGRIYTQLELVKRLKKSYEVEATRRLKIKPEQEPTKEEPAKPEAEGQGTSTPKKPQIEPDPFDTRQAPHG